MPPINARIDKLTRSIENALTGERFLTDILPVTAAEITATDWLFDWKAEIRIKGRSIFKLVTRGNESVIQGLISLSDGKDHVYMNLVESAKFNRGKNKLYLGVAGNLFAFACKYSFQLGYDGFVALTAKTSLIKHYQEKLRAKVLIGPRMYLDTSAALFLIKQYFNDPKQ